MSTEMNWKSLMKQHYPFYSILDVKDIRDADQMHAKKVFKDFEIKNSGKYHDLYLKKDILILADVFKNFKKSVFKNLPFRSCKVSSSS